MIWLAARFIVVIFVIMFLNVISMLFRGRQLGDSD